MSQKGQDGIKLDNIYLSASTNDNEKLTEYKNRLYNKIKDDPNILVISTNADEENEVNIYLENENTGKISSSIYSLTHKSTFNGITMFSPSMHVRTLGGALCEIDNCGITREEIKNNSEFSDVKFLDINEIKQNLISGEKTDSESQQDSETTSTTAASEYETKLLENENKIEQLSNIINPTESESAGTENTSADITYSENNMAQLENENKIEQLLNKINSAKTEPTNVEALSDDVTPPEA